MNILSLQDYGRSPGCAVPELTLLQDDTSKSSSTANELGLANVGGVFVVLMGGMGVACVIAVCEFVWKSRKVAVEERVSSPLTWPLTPDLGDTPNWTDHTELSSMWSYILYGLFCIVTRLFYIYFDHNWLNEHVY